MLVIATSMDSDTENNYFNTLVVESLIKVIMAINLNSVIVIKSTVSVGYAARIKEEILYYNRA